MATTFLMRDIDPKFWRRIKAKAAAEGTTVKALILRLLTQWLAAAILVSLSAGCGYKLPTTPTPAAVAAPVPATVTVTSTAGFGNTAGTVFLVALVKDATGRGVSVPVTFATTAGSLQPATITAGTDGQAQTKVITSSPALVTATAGAAVGSLEVTPIAAVVTTPPEPSPVPSPQPPIPPQPPTPPPTVPLPVATIHLAPIATTAGVSTLFSVGAFMGGQPIVSESWTFGDGVTRVVPATATVYTYSTAGNYTASVTATDTLGRTASSSALVTVAAAPVPVPPPPVPAPSLAAALTCTAIAHGGPTPCNVSVSYAGVPQAATTVTSVGWDWGDGQTTTTTAPVATHTFGTAGSYTIFATVTAVTPDGLKMTTVSQPVVIL